jgi:malate dehydrogenase (oxaloacetate-decarboxylating)
MALAAARAIADVVGEEKLNPTVIVPSVFDSRVAPAVAAAVRAAAHGDTVPAPPATDAPVTD